MNKKNLAAAVLSAAIITTASAGIFSASLLCNAENSLDESTSTTTKSVSAAVDTDEDSESETTTEEETTEPTTEPTTLKTYYIRFLDFDGELMETLEVEEGDPINYKSINTSKLHKHLDLDTEQDFSSWDITPPFADNDYTIHALSKTAKITINKAPEKYRYFAARGKVSLEGLDVSVKLSVQKPEKDANGEYIVEENTVDISASCKAVPSSLSEAFAKSDKATITVYPLGDSKSLLQFDIICYRDLGDVNLDTHINSLDASAVLNAYANYAASSTYTISNDFAKLADVNMDGSVNARDASYILHYYAVTATSSEEMDWDDFFDYDEILGTK